MSGKYWVYYERIGRGKMKKYRCLFNSCGYKLPSYQGIVTHIRRTHDEEIEERNRKARELREERRRRKEEEIEAEREAREIAEEESRERKRMLPLLREQNRLAKEKREREIKRKKKLWDEAQRANEVKRVREAKLWFLFLSELEKSNIPYQEKEFQLIIAEKIGPAWFINPEISFGGDNAMELNKEPNSKKTIKQIQEQELMEAYIGRAKKGERPDSVSTMMILRQIRNIDKKKSSSDNNFMNKMMQLQMMKMMNDR